MDANFTAAGYSLSLPKKVIKLARILVTSPVIKIISTFAGMMQAMGNEDKNKKDKSKQA